MPTFTDLGVAEGLVAALAARGITEPFPIQSVTIPDALAGRDVCGKAPTGSGKTLAFGVPLVTRVQRAESRRPTALVLAPTRELAAQIAAELEQLAAGRQCRIATFYGGVGFGPQLAALRKGVEIAVACPGRLQDLVDRGELRLSDVGIVVVDEADRMADMGFLPVVKRLLDKVRPERQTLLFSATLDGDVAELIRRYQKDPVRREVEGSDESLGELTHHFWHTDRNDRVALTARIVLGHESAMVFCRTRRGVDRVTRQLAQAGVRAAPLHGDRSQAQRDRALAEFRSGSIRALVGTDVAARGIHVENVGCVVHFDPPEDHKTYVHRSGRTARGGASGRVISLVLPEHMPLVRDIQGKLGLERRVATPEASLLVEVAARPVTAPPLGSPAAVGGANGPRPREARSQAPGGQAARRHRSPRPGANGRGAGSGASGGGSASRGGSGGFRGDGGGARRGGQATGGSSAGRNRGRSR